MSTLGARKELWVTKDGQVLDVDEMNENHAKNTLKMLIKQIREGEITKLGYHQERINLARQATVDTVEREFVSYRDRHLNAFERELRGLIGDID